MLKRILTLCLTVTLVFTSVGSILQVNASSTADATASVATGELITSDMTVKTTSTTSPVITLIDTEYAWKINNDKESRMLFDVDDSLGNSSLDGSSYIIEIEYYDYSATISDLSFFSIWVDKLNYGMQRIQDVSLLGDGQWKTVTIEVEDAAFDSNSESVTEADIMLRLYDQKGVEDFASTQPMYFKSLTVTKNTAKNPVLVESYIENVGNTFTYSEEKKVINTFTNTTDAEVSLIAEYFMVDGFGDVRFSFKEDFVISAKGEEERIVTVDSQECGLYQWIVKVSDSTGNINSRFLEDTIAIIKTANDGLKNETAWIVCHLERYRDKSSVGTWAKLTKEQQACMELIKKANAVGTRLQTTWYLAEYTKGNLNVEGTYFWHAAKHLYDAGIDFWVMLSGCADGYSDHTHVPRKMPATQAEINGWEAFCKHVIEKYANTYGVELFEIWNEPNVDYFNEPNPTTGERGTPENLAEITKRAKKAATELYNTGTIKSPVKIAGLSVTELNENDTYNNWLNPAIAAGIVGGDYGMDILNVHTYTHDQMPEEGKVYNSVQKFRNRIKTATNGEVSDIPVLVSEYGNALTNKVSAEEQRDWNVRSAILYRMYGIGEQVAIYNLERKGAITGSGDDHYGIVSPMIKELNIESKVGIPTESYVAYTAMNYILRGDVTPLEMLDCGENIRINHLKRNDLGDNVLAMWSAFNGANVTLDLGVNSVIYYDTFGNERTMTSTDGTYTIPLDSSVSYITGDFTKTDVVDAKEQIICEHFTNHKSYVPDGWSKNSIGGTVNTGTQIGPFNCGDEYGTNVYIGSRPQTVNDETVYGNHAIHRDVSYVVGEDSTPVRFHTDIRIKRDSTDGNYYAVGNEYRACIVRSSDIEDTIFGFKLVGELHRSLFSTGERIYVYYWDENSGDFVKSDKYISLGSWATLEAIYYPENGIVKYYLNGTEVGQGSVVLDSNKVLGRILLAGQTIHSTTDATRCPAIFDNVYLMPYDETTKPVFFAEKEHITNNGIVEFTATALNQFALTDTLTILTAFYDEEGHLKDVVSKPIALTGNKFQNISTDAIEAPSDGMQAKFFIWNMEGLKPISPEYKVRYN